jgi:serine/threonine protein kinase
MLFKYRNNINEDLNLYNIDKCKELIDKNSMLFIDKGQQGEIYKVKSEECGSIIIKKKIFREKDLKWANNEQWIKDEFEVEYKIMLLTNRLIDNFICPNFIKTYGFNKEIPLIIMEYADGDCNFLFKDDYYDTSIYKSFLCQVLIAIYIFNNNTLLYHRDMKPENVLYKKIDKNIVFHYKLNEKDYYVPTYGYLFMISDFGAAKFKLDGREIDIVNLNYKIVKSYILNLEQIYYKYLNNGQKKIITIIKEKEVVIKENNKIFTSIIDKIKINKSIKINTYVFEIYSILNYKENIIDILNHYYNEYTKNNSYDEKNIINFSFDL